MAHPDDITILNASRQSITVHAPAGFGRAAAADSKSIVLSTEDNATMAAIAAQPAGATTDFLPLSPTCHTTIQDRSTIIFLPTVIEVSRANDTGFWLNEVMVQDLSQQKPPMILLFFNDNVSIGSLGGALSIAAADKAKCRGQVLVSAADYIDMGDFWQADYSGIQKAFKPKAGTKNIWVAGVQGLIDNLTFSANSIQVYLSGTQD